MHTYIDVLQRVLFLDENRSERWHQICAICISLLL